MTNKKCPKCSSENIDEGSIGGYYFGYKSYKQGFFQSLLKTLKQSFV